MTSLWFEKIIGSAKARKQQDPFLLRLFYSVFSRHRRSSLDRNHNSKHHLIAATNTHTRRNFTNTMPEVLVDWKSFCTSPASADVTTATSVQATLLLDTHSELGEGIVYDEQRQEIVWCGILDRKFHRLDVTTGKMETMELSKMVCSISLLNTTTNPKLDGAYLFAWEDGFQIFNPTTKESFSDMSAGEDVNPKKLPSRLNDGRCDPTGKRFICGGYYGDLEDVTMNVYSCQLQTSSNDSEDTSSLMIQLEHKPVIENISVTNSLAFSPDGNTMYFADSPTAQIVAYDYNQGATDTSSILSNRRIIYKLELEGAVPDGSCVDADGYVWSATWWHGIQGSRVRRIDPATGKVVFEVHTPDGTSRVSCCCFGGPNLDILFITTAGEGSDPSKEPHAGGLYAVKLSGVKGKLEHRFHMN